MSTSPPIALVGATATGKTDLGEALAAHVDAEIVCADSRQVYRELEIGTGKPSSAQRAQRRHHLFDALAIEERASAGWYAHACAGAIASIRAAGRRPLLVGGSGLYLKAARSGLASIPAIDPRVRERLRAELDAHGPEALHARLAAADPTLAARLAPRDRQRVTRGLEVWEGTGQPLSAWHARQSRDPGEHWIVIELTAEPATHAGLIERRTRWMFDHGLVEETGTLLASGRGSALRALRAVGYDEAAALIEGSLDRKAAEQRTTLRTRQLAKRQRTWFRSLTDARRVASDEHTPDQVLERLIEAAREV